MTEFRKYGRSPLEGRVKLKHRELGEMYAEGGDISASGVFLKIDSGNVMAVGDELDVELPEVEAAFTLLISDSEGEAKLRVVRVTQEGVGLAFI